MRARPCRRRPRAGRIWMRASGRGGQRDQNRQYVQQVARPVRVAGPPDRIAAVEQELRDRRSGTPPQRRSPRGAGRIDKPGERDGYDGAVDEKPAARRHQQSGETFEAPVDPAPGGVDHVVRVPQRRHRAEGRAEPAPVHEHQDCRGGADDRRCGGGGAARRPRPDAGEDDADHRRELRTGGSRERQPDPGPHRLPKIEPCVGGRERRHGDRQAEYRGLVLPERPADRRPETGPEPEAQGEQDGGAARRPLPRRQEQEANRERR